LSGILLLLGVTLRYLLAHFAQKRIKGKTQ